jgi:hypothetical protein
MWRGRRWRARNGQKGEGGGKRSERGGSRTAGPKVFEAIGGQYCLEAGSEGVGPTTSACLKLERAVEKLEEARGREGSPIEREEFDSVVGLMEWVAYFVENGPAFCQPLHLCKRHSKKMFGGHARRVMVSERALSAARELQQRVVARRFRAWKADPVWWHGGLAIAADASTGEGWGAHVGEVYAWGGWSSETKQVVLNSRLQREGMMRVSISPLELLAQVWLLVMVGSSLQRSRNGQIVMHCDNMAAVEVVSSRRPKSAAMRLALQKLEEVERCFGLTVRFDYISTKENKVADALSRGDIALAGECLALQGLMREFDVSTVVEGRTFARMVVESEAEVCGALAAEDLGEGDGECNVVAAAGSIC